MTDTTENKAVGSEVNEILLEAYLSLCVNYSAGDKIYIFGYSRGAAVAKALAAMIDKCGLLKSGYFGLLKHVWDLFTEGGDDHRRFIQARTWEPNISFLGLFEPVLGPKFKEIRYAVPPTVAGRVDFAVEILSLDECRREFESSAYKQEEDLVVPVIAPSIFNGPRRLQQIWMPGGHADIGDPEGKPNFISDLAFMAMVERVCAKTDLKPNLNFMTEIYDTLKTANEIKLSWHPRYVWKRNRVAYAHSWAHMHPVYAKLRDKPVSVNGKVVDYVSASDRRNIYADRISLYPLGLPSIVRGRGLSLEQALWDHVDVVVSQNDT